MEEKLIPAFDYAIENGNIAVFDALAKDFDSFSDDDKKILLIRTLINSPDVSFVKHVIDFGYSLDYENDGATLLHYAAANKNVEIVRFFIEQGLDVNAIDNAGDSPLFCAAEYCENPDVLKELIAAGADTGITGHNSETLLIMAAGRNPNPEITKFLLEQGFDIEERDNDGFTPITNAALWQSNEDVIKVLVDFGADINAKTNDGSNMLHLAVHNENPSVFRYISSSFSTWDVDNDGFSCIRKALINARSPEVVKLLLQKMRIEHIQTACFNENPEILEALIQSGYDVNATDANGATVLMIAAHYNKNPDVIRVLRYYKVIWNNTDEKGRNVLHYAAANEEAAIYEWMLEDDDFKTLADKVDSDGHTPEYYHDNKEELDD